MSALVASVCSPSSATLRITPLVAAAIAYLRARAGARRQLVWPVGHELHLRNLVGARRPQRRGHRARSPEVRRAVDWLLARQHRMEAGAKVASPTCPRGAARRSAVQHAVADGLGLARPDGGGAGRAPGGRPRHRLSDPLPRTGTEIGTSPGIRPSAFRASFICATTGTALFSRSGLSPAIGG